MTETTNDTIQQARDVLAKWRDGSSSGPWVSLGGYINDASRWGSVATGPGYDSPVREHDAALIVGTAGNPELLDAIDALLIWSRLSPESDNIRAAAYEIAAAIIAAEERMSE